MLASGAKEKEVGSELTFADNRSAKETLRSAQELHRARKYADAELLLARAIEQQPDHAGLLNAYGVMLAASGRHSEAMRLYRRAIEVEPNLAGAWTNLGNALTRIYQFQTAAFCHRHAIALSKGSAGLSYHNLGVSLREAHLHGEAIQAFNQALELRPDYHSARWNRALSYLHLGNYAKGWEDYEVRKQAGKLPFSKVSGTQWNGEPYPGKKLLLLSEQGLGDMLWIARYFARVKALGGELWIQCRRELAPLILTMGVADRIILTGEKLPNVDFYLHICSLPRLFTTDFASISREPYILAPPVRTAGLRRAFSTAGARLKVGIVWSGSTTFGRNHRRAQPLSRFVDAFALPGVQLYSLQKGPPESELRSLPRDNRVIDLSPQIKNFADTAAALSFLDLVIMTDSAVAHLAGAMGKPVWVLLGQFAHWLWLLDRGDSPWYPSMQLFRPKAEGDWSHVFDTAAFELVRMSSANVCAIDEGTSALAVTTNCC